MSATVIKFPESRILETEESPSQAYASLSKALGFESYELLASRLREFLMEQKITCYDYAQVKAYLTQQKTAAGHRWWCWRPLRERDHLEIGATWGVESGTLQINPSQDGYYYKPLCDRYDKIVPLHALEKVAKIQAEFGDSLGFLVSDWADPQCDPFLAVTPKQRAPAGAAVRSAFYVIDVWNEPGF